VPATASAASSHLARRPQNEKIPANSLRKTRKLPGRDLARTAQFFSGIRPLRN